MRTITLSCALGSMRFSARRHPFLDATSTGLLGALPYDTTASEYLHDYRPVGFRSTCRLLHLNTDSWSLTHQSLNHGHVEPSLCCTHSLMLRCR
jgi:hypothetical protein